MEVDDDDMEMRRPRGQRRKKAIDSDDEDSGYNYKFDMPVVICDSLEEGAELLRVQLPLRKRDAFSFKSCPRIRYKKKVKLMELCIDADVHSSSFDKKKIDRLPPRAMDSGANMPPEVYEGRCFDTLHPLHYAIGFIKDGKLFLCPVNGTLELKRSMNHLNLIDKQKRAQDTDGEATGESETESVSNTPQAIRVKFSRQETDRQKKRREASALHRERTIANEPWIHLHVVTDNVDKVEKCLGAGTLASIGDRDHDPVMEVRDLVTKTLTVSQTIITDEQKVEMMKCPTLSLQKATKLSPVQQVLSIMLKAHSMSLSSLCSVLPSTSTLDVVHILRQYARLVQGVWVVRSEQLFAPPQVNGVRLSRMTGTRPKLWRDARDFALAIIDADLRITRGTLSRLFRLSRDDAQEVLETVGEPDAEKRSWRLAARREERKTGELDDVLLAMEVEDAEYWVTRFDEIMAEVGERTSPRRQRRASTRAIKAEIKTEP